MNVFILAVFISAFSIFFYDFPGWFDSAELALSAHTLGVGHPPAQPFYTLLGSWINLLPIGTPSFRLSLLSSTSGVLAVLVFAKLFQCLQNTKHNKETSQLENYIFLGFGLLVLFHVSVSLQLTRVELYSLEVLLLLLSLLSGIRFQLNEDSRWSLLAIFLFGLSFGIQPAVSLMASPLLALVFIHPTQRFIQTRRIAFSLVFFFLSLLLYLYLPLRSIQMPALNWDEPLFFHRFWFAIQAKDYHGSLRSIQSFSELWTTYQKVLDLIPIPLFLLSGLGAIALWKKQKKIISLILVTTTGSTLAIWGRLEFVSKNPDSHGYLSFSLFLIFLLASIGAKELFLRTRLKRSFCFLLAFVLILLSSWRWILNPQTTLKAHGGPQAKSLSSFLDQVSPGASIQVSSDHWLFPLWYRSWVEGRRPDVEIIGAGLWPATWYRSQVKQKYGDTPFPRKVWMEYVKKKTQKPLFLGHSTLGRSTWIRFENLCQKITRFDPFAIQRSLCAQILLTWSNQRIQNGFFDEGKNLLEGFVGTSKTKFSCARPGKIELPYPLYRDFAPPFLVEPDRLESELLLLYMGCGQTELAMDLLYKHVFYDLDAQLIAAFLVWNLPNPHEAISRLKDIKPKNRVQKGVVSLAKATFWAKIDLQKAKKELSCASKILGDHPAIVQLDQQIKNSL